MKINESWLIKYGFYKRGVVDMDCDYCQKHKKLLECSFNGISLAINLINKTQLDAMAKVKYPNGRITSVGQSNTIKYCPMCGREL